MKIRRFYSKSMRNALKQVTDEFGSDAAILSSQKTASGVEVIAALDYDAELLPESISSLGKRKEEIVDQINHTSTYQSNNESNISHIDSRQSENRIADKYETKDYDGGSKAVTSNKQSHLSDFDNVNNGQIKYGQNSSGLGETGLGEIGLGQAFNLEETNSSDNKTFASESLAGLNPKTKHSNLVEWSTDPGLIAMKEELALMRSMMKEQLDGIGWERLTERDPVTAMLNRRLSSLGISQPIIDQLIPKINSKLDPECCWQNLLAILAKSIPTDVTNIIANGGILAFMGGSGTGKTTTIAKLAARYVIKHGRDSVALITTDNYRAAGLQQLQSFAKILNLPVAQVSSKNTLDNLIEKFSDKKLILIDTPGMNRNDNEIIKQLRCLKDSAITSNGNTHSGFTTRPIKKLLLLPATHQQSVLQQSLNLFKAYSPDSCIITNVDEATSLGEVLSCLIENRLPVAYTTDGQKVPENIRVARNHHLVSKAVWLSNKYKSQDKITIPSEKKALKVAG
ncbi:MAG: flagellar biosynthesis protein FlhF [Gammaproteobacteria bacterium]|nr:MAG: flagellar biosynthesis protein FlhF [Gammaproteobacteria bacterium]